MCTSPARIKPGFHRHILPDYRIRATHAIFRSVQGRRRATRGNVQTVSQRDQSCSRHRLRRRHTCFVRPWTICFQLEGGSRMAVPRWGCVCRSPFPTSPLSQVSLPTKSRVTTTNANLPHNSKLPISLHPRNPYSPWPRSKLLRTQAYFHVRSSSDSRFPITLQPHAKTYTGSSSLLTPPLQRHPCLRLRFNPLLVFPFGQILSSLFLYGRVVY